MDLSKLSTYELIEELSKRDSVTVEEVKENDVVKRTYGGPMIIIAIPEE